MALAHQIQQLRIGELAQLTDVPAKTIRFYEEIGLLPQARRAHNGYRVYDEDDVKRLRFVRNARGLGLTLDELKETLTLFNQVQPPCEHVEQRLEIKLVEVDAEIQRLQALRDDLQTILDRADTATAPIACACQLIYEHH